NKLDPTAFKIADIYQTKVCPLARTMRHELKKRGIKNLKVVYSEEQPVKIINNLENSDTRRSIPTSNAFVPSVAGLILAGEVIKDLVKLA
ncbi:MAG: tRNA threonylcarbamoyladenosine dehydratase, partial [Oscillospiraceae bacterium]|nr:tRNA threonylcarbamoyladenosine dehydratase [Oscillospiraceae bacterium]